MKKLPLCTLKTRFYLIVRIHVFQSNLSHFPFISLIARFAPDLGPGSSNRLNVNIQFSHRFTVHVVPKRQTASDGRIEVPADQCSSIPFWNTTCFHVQVMTLTEEHLWLLSALSSSNAHDLDFNGDLLGTLMFL